LLERQSGFQIKRRWQIGLKLKKGLANLALFERSTNICSLRPVDWHIASILTVRSTLKALCLGAPECGDKDKLQQHSQCSRPP
jgi:hypothetical protein